MRVLALLGAALLSAAIGCSDSSTGPGKGPVGVWELRTVDAERLPAEIYHGPYFDEVNQRFFNQLIVKVTVGEIRLDDDGRYRLDLEMAFWGDGETGTERISGEGSYVLWDEAIDFKPDGNPNAALSASFVDGTITLPLSSWEEGEFFDFAFRKAR
jgi:hypothetical protein